MTKIWVVKLGGSLLGADSLKQWLDIFTRKGAGRVVIVPGGGIFADHIRHTQRQWRFDDKAAHQMALLAMHQYAHLMKSCVPQLALASTVPAIVAAVDKGIIPVWLPATSTLKECDNIPQDWRLSSDSLALLLAEALGAGHVMLVKSTGCESLSACRLAAVGKVDEVFPEFASRAAAGLWWIEHKDMTNMKKILSEKIPLQEYLQPIITGSSK